MELEKYSNKGNFPLKKVSLYVTLPVYGIISTNTNVVWFNCRIP